MKKILITGGSRGIGKSCIKKFLDEGYFVYSCSRESIDIEHENLKHYTLDLLKPESVGYLRDRIPSIDCLLNNAGAMNTDKFLNYNLENRNRLLDLNLFKPIELTEAFMKNMIDQGGGRIINMSSIAAHVGHPDIYYGISKAGILNFTRSIARQFGDKNIQSFAIAPGPVNTNMLLTIPEERKTKLKKNSLTSSFVQPDEIANLAYFLAENAPNTMSGDCIDINNGTYFN